MRLFDLINNRLPDTLHLVGAEDRVLLRQEGVYLMTTGLLSNLPCPVYCLAHDAAVRGIPISEPLPHLATANGWI